MAFTPLNLNEVLPGKSVKTEMLQKVRTNLSELDERTTSLEAGGNTIYPPIIMRINGNYASVPLDTQVLLTTINFNLTLTGIFLICESNGSGGSTQIDVQFKRGADAWTSVFTTKPSLANSAGALAISSNGVLDATKVNLLAGDYIRLVLTSKQSGTPRGLLVRIDFNKT